MRAVFDEIQYFVSDLFELSSYMYLLFWKTFCYLFKIVFVLANESNKMYAVHWTAEGHVLVVAVAINGI